VKEYEIEGEENFEGSEKQHFATDFLTDRGIEFMEKAARNNKPFALVLSIPDPHSKCTLSIFSQVLALGMNCATISNIVLFLSTTCSSKQESTVL